MICTQTMLDFLSRTHKTFEQQLTVFHPLQQLTKPWHLAPSTQQQLHHQTICGTVKWILLLTEAVYKLLRWVKKLSRDRQRGVRTKLQAKAQECKSQPSKNNNMA